VDLLLDTNVLIWWLQGSPRLGDQARTVMINPGNRVFVSAASGWEIAMKYSLGKLRLPDTPSTWLPTELSANRFTPSAINMQHVLAVENLPPHHRDPFDRLLVAQATEEGLTIVTGDPQLKHYDVTIIMS
jgi:PIN domain nuclease of toxin-antitoxin system